MRSLLLKSVVFFILSHIICFSEDFEFSPPLTFDIMGVEIEGETIAGYGNFGSVLISFDDAKTWKQIQPFKSGNIINFFIEEDKLVAFKQTGEVSVSFDSGSNWEIKKPINDSLVYIVKGGGNYYVTGQKGLYKISEDFEKVAENLVANSAMYKFNYNGIYKNTVNHYVHRRQITYLKNSLFVITDTSKIVKYDENLQAIDTIAKEKLFNSDVTNNQYIYYILSDSSYIYIRKFEIGDEFSTLQKIDPEFISAKKILNFGENPDLFSPEYPYSIHIYVSENAVYSANRNTIKEGGPYFQIYQIHNEDSVESKTIIKCTAPKSSGITPHFTEIKIENNKVVAVTRNKFLSVKNINEEKTNIASEFFNYGPRSVPFPTIVNDTTQRYGNYISTNGGATFHYDSENSQVDPDISAFRTVTTYYDEERDLNIYLGFENKLPFQDTAIVYISRDGGKTLDKKIGLETLKMYSTWLPRIYKHGENYLITAITLTNLDYKWLNRMFWYDKDFNLLDTVNYKGYRLSDVYLHEYPDKFLIGASDTSDIDYSEYFMYTEDKGQSWTKLREYGFVADTIYYNEDDYLIRAKDKSLKLKLDYQHNGKDYWIAFSHNSEDSVYAMDILDLEAKNAKTVFSKKTPEYRNTAFTTYEDSIYIAYGDTLFYFHSDELCDTQKWDYHVLPNNGHILNYRLKVYGNNRFCALYTDDLRDTNTYWFTIDEITSIEENKTEIKPYLYADKPYPIPAGNSVTAEIYWDINFNLQIADIRIYDIKGNRVEGDENIEINSQSNWPGRLTWDCSQVSDGIYFIVIEYGKSSKSIPIIKKSNR